MQPTPALPSPDQITVLATVRNRRSHGKILFWDLVCHSGDLGQIQAVLRRETFGDRLDEFKRLKPESSVRITATLTKRQQAQELVVHEVEVVSEATGVLTPGLHEDFNPFDERYVDTVMTRRHLYLRHEHIAAIMRFRSLALLVMREWFDQKGIIEFTAPVLTPVPLYADRSAISFHLDGDAKEREKVFLTQCVGYYLEAAAHALGPVYNIGPSFRGERSKSRRHLMEYWHVKAELLGGDLETIIDLCEDLVSFTVDRCREEGEKVCALLGTRYAIKEGDAPYERIGYREAVAFLQKQGSKIVFGEGISGEDEHRLSLEFNGPFWIVGNPRTIEPFPYIIDPNDPELTLTADLISPEGFGELLGTAEKIYDMEMFDVRMKEKGKFDDPRYAWIREMREFGLVPHIAFGMGLERFIRWLVGASHVRDVMPFPRVFHRNVHP